MRFQNIEVEYIFESDDMTDEEYSNQEEQTFIVTEEMIYELVEQHVKIPEGKEICQTNFFMNIKR